MGAVLRGKGSAEDVADQARRHLEKLKTYYEIVNNATADTSFLAVRANELRLELFNMRRIQLNNDPQAFLDKKRLLFFFDGMLKLLWVQSNRAMALLFDLVRLSIDLLLCDSFTEKQEMPKMKQKREFVTNSVKQKVIKKKKIEVEVEAVM